MSSDTGTQFVEQWHALTRGPKKDGYLFAHTREDRLRHYLFRTLYYALYRRIEYFLTFKLKLFPEVVSTETFWGEKVRASRYDYHYLSRWGFFSGEEMLLTNFLIENLKPGDVFFDIGANFGWYTFLTAKLGCNVHAFEPTPRTFGLLIGNTRGKSSITCSQKAVWKEDGVIQFHDFGGDRDVSNTAQESDVSEFLVKEQDNEHAAVIDVKAITIDTYCKNLKLKPTFINIDTEGSEFNALLGAKATIASSSPIFGIEIWKNMIEDGKCRKIVDFLAPYSYRAYTLEDNWTIQPFNFEKTDKGLITLIFIPTSRLPDIKTKIS